ncbi:MAG: uracil-DNA glycosylase [Candidatus Pacebacteria bacterium]|nr:uracil-DNA glycosylase [Candidatus Paceibacterota bacterium]MBP9842610.1 uracil-DNA glycosylase [Candidatus Paceibacterota bacterium]
MEIKLEATWKNALQAEFEKPYFHKLTEKVRAAYLTGGVYPPPKFVFNALSLCPFKNVRVVILGQDPYHGDGQAHGLSFSVPEGVRIPPSLQNIYKEIASDLNKPIPLSGNLEHWATQGVLLLNATLTVESSKPASHQGWGWEIFTDAIIETISKNKEHVVFLLWGNYARAKRSLIDGTKHLILEAPHPSPFSAHTGFLGCKHFSKTNDYLAKHDLPIIEW